MTDTNRTTDRDIIGRLAQRPWREGDSLPEVGSQCLVSGSNQDMESDQHRSYSWRTVIGYSAGNKFVCLQTRDCWPTVERLENCWFADERHILNAAAPAMLAALRRIALDPIGPPEASHERVLEGMVEIAKAALAKAEGRS